jgi:hypothetical protein
VCYLAYLLFTRFGGRLEVAIVKAAGRELHAARYVIGPSAVNAEDYGDAVQKRVKSKLYHSFQVLRCMQGVVSAVAVLLIRSRHEGQS